MTRSRVLLSSTLSMLLCATALGASSSVALGQGTTVTPIQVTLTPTKPTGPKGIAILAPSDTATSVQVLAQGAAQGTTATINPGTCAQVGADMVGLVGELNATGQAQAIVPVPISTLADGAHVIVLHPGLDLGTSVACGLIPLTDTGVVVPVLPTPGTAQCQGVPAWVATTKTRLGTLKTLNDAANKAAAGVNIQAYLSTLATNIGQVQAMIDQAQADVVPPAATATQELFIQALQKAADSATELIQAYGQSDATLYQEALTKGQEAQQSMLTVTTQVAELDAKCP